MKQEKREKLHLVLIQMRYSKMASLLPNFVRSTRLKQKPQSTMWLTPLALGIAEALSKTRKTSITFCLSLHPMKRLMPLLCFSNLITTGCQPLFKFCVKELLTQLHKSLMDNIIFSFTNCRATFFRPGNTLPVLKNFLKEEEINITVSPSTYFCFDNEAFRYLITQKTWFLEIIQFSGVWILGLSSSGIPSK